MVQQPEVCTAHVPGLLVVGSGVTACFGFDGPLLQHADAACILLLHHMGAVLCHILSRCCPLCRLHVREMLSALVVHCLRSGATY